MSQGFGAATSTRRKRAPTRPDHAAMTLPQRSDAAPPRPALGRSQDPGASPFWVRLLLTDRRWQRDHAPHHQGNGKTATTMTASDAIKIARSACSSHPGNALVLRGPGQSARDQGWWFDGAGSACSRLRTRFHGQRRQRHRAHRGRIAAASGPDHSGSTMRLARHPGRRTCLSVRGWEGRLPVLSLVSLR